MYHINLSVIKEISYEFSYPIQHNFCVWSQRKQSSPATLRNCETCFLHLHLVLLHSASFDNSHTNTAQKIPITMVYITPQNLLCLCMAAWVCLCDYVLENRRACYVVLIIEFRGKNYVKKATLYLWLDRYPPVDRYTVIMWLSGVATGRSLSCESGFPCIRESLLVYLSPPQRPTCTSRHQQDKTRCHIYEAVSSTLKPQRLTAGLWDFAGEGYSLSAYPTPEPTTA